MQLDELEELLGPRTKMLAITHMSNVLGTIVPRKEIVQMAHAKGIPVLAISDEEAGSVAAYLKKRREAFFESVAVDPLRRSFIAYGVSGTPTIVLVDDKGVVRHRQVGYKAGDGLTVEGRRWSPGTSSP